MPSFLNPGVAMIVVPIIAGSCYLAWKWDRRRRGLEPRSHAPGEFDEELTPIGWVFFGGLVATEFAGLVSLAIARDNLLSKVIEVVGVPGYLMLLSISWTVVAVFLDVIGHPIFVQRPGQLGLRMLLRMWRARKK